LPLVISIDTDTDIKEGS